MFILSVVEDKVKVAPELFSRDFTEVVIEQIEIKYINKVLLDCGLCISVYDILEADDPTVHPAEGCCHQFVKFRLVVFKPFMGEILIGKVLSSNEDGIKVTLDFFDDILIPNNLLPNPSEYDKQHALWIWKFQQGNNGDSGEEGDNGEGGGGGGGDVQDLVLDIGDPIRFRIRKIEFTGITATAKGLQTTVTSESRFSSPPTTNSTNNANVCKDGTHDNMEIPIPMTRRRSSSSIGLTQEEGGHLPPSMLITGCINEDGLGMVSWWE